MATKLNYSKLTQIFCELMSNASDFSIIDSGFPILVSYNEDIFYVYIKNLSSAYFENDDVMRAQLPFREEFAKVKVSEFKIVFLGYDQFNEVFVAWNPYYVKQRLNSRRSLSFYSRLIHQTDAGKFHYEIHFQDSHNNDVYAFPQEQLSEFLKKIFDIFENDTYVAIGSKSRPEANKAFTTFNNAKSVERFYYHMHRENFDDDLIVKYTALLMRLVRDNVFGKTRTLFMANDHISQYKNSLDKFRSHAVLEEYSDNKELIINALLSYIDYLSGYETGRYKDREAIDLFNQPNADYETPYIGKNGKLTKIANPDLLQRLRPHLDKKFATPMTAFPIIEEFYGDRFSDTMSFNDWCVLFDTIVWED